MIKDSLISNLRYAVIDVETTGLASSTDRIIEIAVAYNNNGKILNTYSELINPGISIPWVITDITGITDVKLRKAPQFKEIADGFVDLLKDRVLIAHNSFFDINFISAELKRCHQKNLSNSVLCTLRMSRHLCSNLENHKLGTLADFFGIKIKKQHRALGDALATAEIFLKLSDIAEKKGITKLSQLMKIA